MLEKAGDLDSDLYMPQVGDIVQPKKDTPAEVSGLSSARDILIHYVQYVVIILYVE